MAWDQINELIIEAHKSKPRARFYDVTGAGLDWVNGCYTFWAVAFNKSSKGVAPAPKLEPQGLIMNDGMTEADFSVHRLKNYILSANLIQEVYGPSMHQEAV
jgi:hypothetical protein